ncbi:hypothetical protein [Selenomonas artemidis]|uniref:Uncharacterized protein n=1 Tax=Selenomonas artemidis F0399 TaxID=749551 RepID=E7N3C7_9FIRM|nr:hypothetical protein [Selenomonas artemidis]EFW29325.1 hypothetical protein HMPREF9555_01502 [Selenomonas artemidis F0399]
MLIFSTRLPVKDTLTKGKFFELVIRWNQDSPHHRIDGIEWDGGYRHRWGDMKNMLEITEYNDVAAAHFVQSEHGVHWTTEFILHTERREIGIYLSREATENTVYFHKEFKPPYFLKLLMRENVLGSDGGLAISEYPQSFGAAADERKVLAQLCLEDDSAFRLPVVYLTREWFIEHCVVDEGVLARRLCGVAHVLVESDKDVSRTLKDLCHGKNVYNGGMAVYFPSVSAAAKRFIPYDGMDVEKVMTQMVRMIFRYMNQQKREPLDTWDGIQMMQMRRQTKQLLAEKRRIEENRKQTSKEKEQYWDEYVKAQTQVEALTEQNARLQSELAVLRARVDSMGENPLLYYGDEREFYQGEMLEFVRTALSEKLDRLPKEKDRHLRCADVLQDLLNANESEEIQAQRQTELKRVLKGYRTLTPEIQSTLIDAGFRITDGKHYKLTYYDDERYTVTMAKSGSDWRGGENLISEIRKRIY